MKILISNLLGHLKMDFGFSKCEKNRFLSTGPLCGAFNRCIFLLGHFGICDSARTFRNYAYFWVIFTMHFQEKNTFFQKKNFLKKKGKKGKKRGKKIPNLGFSGPRFFALFPLCKKLQNSIDSISKLLTFLQNVSFIGLNCLYLCIKSNQIQPIL